MRPRVATAGDAVGVGSRCGFAEQEILAESQSCADTVWRKLPLPQCVAGGRCKPAIRVASDDNNIGNRAVTGKRKLELDVAL